MIEKLLQYYQNTLIDNIPDNYEEYDWYRDENNRVIGILQSQLLKKDRELLSIFLTPIPIDEYSNTQEQQIWKDILLQGKAPSSFPSLHKKIEYIRFLHFFIKQPFFEKKGWEEALKGLLSSSFIIIWIDHHHGIIIETYPYAPSFIDDHEMIQTLTSDFYVSLKILSGTVRICDESLSSFYRWEDRIFQQTTKFMNKQIVYQLEDVLPYLLVTDPLLIQPLLVPVQHDVQLLQTIRTYLECNMNVSLTAKKEYMHRNSVQYRVDKFIEKTGIDIKTFKGAATIYFALLQQETV